MFKREVVCVSSGTAALHLSLEAIGLKEGDEVLVSGLTFVATFQAIIEAGGTPIACDVQPHDLSININDAQVKLTSRTKAIIPVHYTGNPGNLKEIYEYAKKNNLRVIEDAAHAFGSMWERKLIGEQGDIVCFSFDPIKNITCGDGGAVVSDDNKIIDAVRSMRFLGIKMNRNGEQHNLSAHENDIIGCGWRYHMNNINAAIGLAQLKKFEYFKKKRQILAKQYCLMLSDNSNIDLLLYNYDEVVPHLFVVKLKTKNNMEVITELSKVNIKAGYHYYPPHLYKYMQSVHTISLPVLESLFKKLISLPLHPGMDEKDVKYVCRHFNEIV